MNKGELISQVAETAGLSKKDAEKAVGAVLDSISGALVKGDKVQLIGFGTLRSGKEQQEQAAIPRPGMKSRLSPPKFLPSKPARL